MSREFREIALAQILHVSQKVIGEHFAFLSNKKSIEWKTRKLFFDNFIFVFYFYLNLFISFKGTELLRI